VIVYNGLEFKALGGAALADSGGGGTVCHDCLVISNIGSSGDDGICMEPGPGQGAWVQFDRLPEPTAAQVAVVIITGLTALGTNLDTKFGRVAAKDTANTRTLETDYSFIGSLARRVEVWNNGLPVAQFAGVTDPIGISEMPISMGMATDGMIHPLPNPVLPAATPEPLRPYSDAAFPVGTAFSIGVPPVIVSGDEIREFPENPTTLPTNLSGLEVTFQVDRSMAPDTVVISDAAMRHFGRMHRGTGDVVIKADTSSAGAPDYFQANLDVFGGNSGSVVMSIGPDNLGPAPGATTGEECIIWDIQDSCVGEDDEFSVDGILASAPGVVQSLAKFTSFNDGAQLNVTPDFSPVGSSTPMLQLKNANGDHVLLVPTFSGSYTVSGIERPVELGAARNGTITLIQGFASERSINVPGHGIFTASRVELSAPVPPALVTSYTSLSRHLTNHTGGKLTVKVEKSQFKGADLDGVIPIADVRTTGLAYATAGYDYLVFHSDADPLAPGSSGDIIFENLGGTANNYGVKWLPLGPAPPAAAGEIEIVQLGPPDGSSPNETGENATARPGSDAVAAATHFSGLSVKLVSNGAGADMFVDPGTSGATEVEVIVRDKDGRVTLRFPWSNFSVPALAIPDFPIAAGSHSLTATGERGIWFDLGYETTLPIGPMVSAMAGSSRMAGPGAMARSSTMTKAELVEVLHEPADSSGSSLDPGFGIRAPGFTEMVFTGEFPRAVGVVSVPRQQTAMHLPYPNPFNPSTTLSFELRQPGEVSLRVYTVEGRYVTTVHAGRLAAGPHAFKWDGRNRHGRTVASGVYLVELRAPDGVRHAKLNLLK